MHIYFGLKTKTKSLRKVLHSVSFKYQGFSLYKCLSDCGQAADKSVESEQRTLLHIRGEVQVTFPLFMHKPMDQLTPCSG